MTDPASELQVRARPSTLLFVSDPLPKRLWISAWAVVVVAHVALILGLIDLLEDDPSPSGEALQVVFLPREEQARLPAPPPLPVPPTRPRRAERSYRTDTAPVLTDAPTTAEAPSQAAPEPEPELRLFNPDGSMLLPELPTEVREWTDAERLQLDRTTALPGHSDSAAAEKVALRLRRAMAPSDVVNAVLRFLFGQVQADDCSTIENRLVASDADVVREIDMVKYRKICL